VSIVEATMQIKNRRTCKSIIFFNRKYA